MTTYAGCADDKAFYAEFDRRLAMAKEKLGLMQDWFTGDRKED